MNSPVTLASIVARVRMHGNCLMPRGEVDVDFIVKETIEALGFQLNTSGEVVTRSKREWEPPGGLERQPRFPRRGRRR